MNKVYIGGRSAGDFNFANRTVAEVRHLLNGQVTANMACYINGSKVEDHYVIGNSSELSFQKAAGTKG